MWFLDQEVNLIHVFELWIRALCIQILVYIGLIHVSYVHSNYKYDAVTCLVSSLSKYFETILKFVKFWEVQIKKVVTYK